MRAVSLASEERPVRQGPRALLRTWALYFVWGAAHDGVVVDVGAGGAFIAAEAPPAEGTLITLRLLVPGAMPFTVLAPRDDLRRSDGGGRACARPVWASRFSTCASPAAREHRAVHRSTGCPHGQIADPTAAAEADRAPAADAPGPLISEHAQEGHQRLVSRPASPVQRLRRCCPRRRWARRVRAISLEPTGVAHHRSVGLEAGRSSTIPAGLKPSAVRSTAAGMLTVEPKTRFPE